MVMNKISPLVGKYEEILLVSEKHLGVACVCPPRVLCARCRRTLHYVTEGRGG